MRTFKLSDDDYNLLVWALGCATGQCIRDDKLIAVEKLRELFNRLQCADVKESPETGG